MKKYYILPKTAEGANKIMMDWSRIIGALGLIVQILNVALVFITTWKPEWAIVVAGFISAIQAFTVRIQGTPTK